MEENARRAPRTVVRFDGSSFEVDASAIAAWGGSSSEGTVWDRLLEAQARATYDTAVHQAHASMAALSTSGLAPGVLREAMDALLDTCLAEFTARLARPHEALRRAVRDELEAAAEAHCAASRDLWGRRMCEGIALVEQVVTHSDATLRDMGSVVRHAVQQLELELEGDTQCLDEWRARCLDRMIDEWLPRHAAAHESEQEWRELELQELRTRHAGEARDPQVLDVSGSGAQAPRDEPTERTTASRPPPASGGDDPRPSSPLLSGSGAQASQEESTDRTTTSQPPSASGGDDPQPSSSLDEKSPSH